MIHPTAPPANRVDRVDISVAGLPDGPTDAGPAVVADPDAGTSTTVPTRVPGQTWLLVGVDSTTDSRIAIDRPATELTDTIVLVRVTGDGGLRFLSVPRDLFVTYAGGGQGRINAAYTFGGGFARAIDAAGGVESRFPNDLRSIREPVLRGRRRMCGARRCRRARLRASPIGSPGLRRRGGNLGDDRVR